MATIIEMGIPNHRGPYPKVIIQNPQDAQTFVAILKNNGVPVNLREIPDTPVNRDDDLADRIEQHKKNYPGTSLDI